MKRPLIPVLSCLFLIPACAKDDGGTSTGASGSGSGEESADDSSSSSDSGATASGSSGSSTTSSGTTGSTSSTTGGTSSSESGGEETGTPIVVMPDGGGGGEVECDIWAQDCPPGTKCMPWANDGGNAWNATKCTMLDPSPKAPGDECNISGSGVSGVDNCDLGAMCWNPDENGVGYCLAMCMGPPTAPTCENPTSHCNISNDGTLILCQLSCDPLIQDCPTDRDVCVQTADGTGFICSLDSSGTVGGYGDPCEYVNACDPGLFCSNPEGVPGCTGSIGCCSEFCDITMGDEQCQGMDQGQQCVSYFMGGEPPPGYENVGGCTVPA